MVDFLYSYFNNNTFLESLQNISDGICEDNEKKYIKFDNFKKPSNCDEITKGMNSLSSVDSILINKEKEHIIFVEFKDMQNLTTKDNIKAWLKEKDCSIKVEIPDSLLLLGYFIKKRGYSFDEYFRIDKSFFYVYKSDSSKQIINNHLKYRFTKYNFMLKNIKSLECQNYKKFLERNNL